MIDKHLIDTAYIVTETRDEYGDHVLVSEAEVSCWFRYITDLQTNEVDTRDADALIWLAASASVGFGTIIKYDGLYYRVERLTRARRLRSTDVLFIKCLLKVFSIS